MLDNTEVLRRICPVIFLLDTSGSMSGAPIGAVNAAMEEVLLELRSINTDNQYLEMLIAVMTFGSDVAWHTATGLITPEDYSWSDLNANGGTSMGAAFKELNKVFSASNGFMNLTTNCSVLPVLFILTDGEPTDDYQEWLQKLQENKWYKIATKVAIGYGKSKDSVLEEFTGNSEAVLHTNNPKDLVKLIYFATTDIGYGKSKDSILETFTGNFETMLHTNNPKDFRKTDFSWNIVDTGYDYEKSKDSVFEAFTGTCDTMLHTNNQKDCGKLVRFSIIVSLFFVRKKPRRDIAKS